MMHPSAAPCCVARRPATRAVSTAAARVWAGAAAQLRAQVVWKTHTLRELHAPQKARGLGANNAYTPFEPGKELDVVLKPVHTLALWQL